MQLWTNFVKITRDFFLSSFFFAGIHNSSAHQTSIFPLFLFLYIYPVNTIDTYKRAHCTRGRNTGERGEKDFPDTSNSIGVESFRWKPLVELWNIFQTSRGSSKLLASGFPWFRGSTFHQKAMMEPWKHRSSLTIGRWKLLSYIRVRHPAREVC